MRALDTGRELCRARRRPREESERAIDVKPRSVPLRQVGHSLERIEVAGIHLTRVPHDDRGRTAE